MLFIIEQSTESFELPIIDQALGKQKHFTINLFKLPNCDYSTVPELFEDLNVLLRDLSIIFFSRHFVLYISARLSSQQTFIGLEEVLETSSRHVLMTSSKRLQRNNFSSSKTSWKTKNCYAEDVLKTSARHVLKTNKCLLGS